MCGNPHDGEDLVQETYAKVLSRPRFIRHDDDLGYLLRALRNTHISRLRRAGGALRRPSWRTTWPTPPSTCAAPRSPTRWGSCSR